MRGRLRHRAKVPGCGPDEFHKPADEAKENCPVSRVPDAETTLDAKPG